MSLTGTLTVNGAPEQVTATIGADGSVSGKLLNPDGSMSRWDAASLERLG